MIPNGILSSTPVPGTFLAPDDLPPSEVIDYELGGIGISDASTGLLVQVWTATLVGNPGEIGTSIWLSAPNTSNTFIYAEDGITEISLTFDQNMHPFFAFVAGGRAKIRWYDTTLPGFRVTLLPDGSTYPRCTLDDKRPLATLAGLSDILVAYIFDDDLLMLVQRERYNTPHTLLTGLSAYIANPFMAKVGMTTSDRVQFMIAGGIYR